MHLVEDARAERLGDREVDEVAPVGARVERRVDMHNGGVAEDDRRGEEERAHEEPQESPERALVAALAPDLEMHDLEIIGEPRFHQEIHVRAHAAHRGAMRPEKDDDGMVHDISWSARGAAAAVFSWKTPD